MDANLRAYVDGSSTPFWVHLGIRMVEVEVGLATLTMSLQTELGTFGRPGVIHGGALASLIDAAAATAARSTRGADAPPFRAIATTDLNVSYLAAALTDVTAVARILRAGRTMAWADVEVRDTSDALVAVGRATLTIRRDEATAAGGA